jgi:hypothetical protein
MGKVGWSQRQKLGSTALSIIKRSPGKAMLLQHGTGIVHKLGVIYDGSLASSRALRLAASLLPDPQAGLSILILTEKVEQAHKLQPDVESWLGMHNLRGRIYWVHGPGGKRLAHLVHAEHLGILVIPAHLDALQDDELEEFLNETTTPTLLMR